jgi:hypothetical protein
MLFRLWDTLASGFGVSPRCAIDYRLYCQQGSGATLPIPLTKQERANTLAWYQVVCSWHLIAHGSVIEVFDSYDICGRVMCGCEVGERG